MKALVFDGYGFQQILERQYEVRRQVRYVKYIHCCGKGEAISLICSFRPPQPFSHIINFSPAKKEQTV
jgi:hypothetical protein